MENSTDICAYFVAKRRMSFESRLNHLGCDNGELHGLELCSQRYYPNFIDALRPLTHGGKSDQVDAICFVRPHFSESSSFDLAFYTPFFLTFPESY
jgi:hypothetical protein